MKDYLKFAIISYLDGPEGNRKLLEFCESSQYYDAHELTDGASDAQFFAAHTADELIIAIRGSSSLSDFVVDVKFLQVDAVSKGVRVHRGFYEQFKSIASVIDAILSKTKMQTVTFVGHSLGGALATIAALAAKNNFPHKTVKCISYGSPRVGNQKFADEFDRLVDSSLRVVNGQDIVTTRPYWGYAHVKGLMKIGRPFSMWKYWGSIEDHRTDQYMENLVV